MFDTAPVKQHRILDFDIENRPLSYWYDGNCTAEVTAIAWSFVGEDHVECYLLEPPPRHVVSAKVMLSQFSLAYEQADVVTGHYIRRHDLPLLNGAMLEHNLPPLGAKLVSDTQTDFIKRKDISASQESLGAMFGLVEDKYHMSQGKWREANRLTPEGLEQTHKRVVDDVVQHKALRAALCEAGVLRVPSIWRP